MHVLCLFGNLIFRYQRAALSRLGYVPLSAVQPEMGANRVGTSQQGIHMKALSTTICAGSLAAAGLVGCNENNVLAGAQA